MRIQRFLAEAGLGSRRACEDLVRQGRVMIGAEVAALGATVDPRRDKVTVDGERVRLPRVRIYLAMYKPRGVITTARDQRGRPTVYELLPKLPVRVNPVGRLDFNSEGLLLFTNDGLLAHALTHPSGAVEREYQVKIQGVVPEWAIEKVKRGVRLEDGLARATVCARVESGRVKTNTWLRVVVAEGRYREVRRMFGVLGFNVLKLKRVRFGPVLLGRMKPGEVRELVVAEVKALCECVGGQEGRGDGQ